MSDDTPDPVTVLRVHLAADPPAVARFYLCPRKLAFRLAAYDLVPIGWPGTEEAR